MSIKTLSTIAVVLCCLGCQPSTPAEKLVGKWRLDVECTIAQDREVQNLVNLHKLSRIDMQQLLHINATEFVQVNKILNFSVLRYCTLHVETPFANEFFGRR